MKFLRKCEAREYWTIICYESYENLKIFSGGYLCSAWCTALAYDEAAKYAFIGDYSGQITVCQLSDTGVKLINVLKGHNGSIQSLCWDGSQGSLFSGNFWNKKVQSFVNGLFTEKWKKVQFTKTSNAMINEIENF